jgi:hypothetical protein
MKITIDTHNCSREELAELKEYLGDNSWDFKTDEPKEKSKYILFEDRIHIVGSHGVTINEKIFNEELFEYRIEDRKELINNLIGWIAESNKDSLMMQQDMEMLMDLEDDYIFSSISTNEYISKDDGGFNETCKQLIELTESL